MDASTTIEELWEKFEDILLSTTKETCGIKIVGECKKRTNWWIVSIKEKVKIKKQRRKEHLQKEQKVVI